MDELCYLSIAEAARLLAARKVSPLELTKAHLQRIEKYDSQLRSYITVSSEVALRQAREATDEMARARPNSMLHGMPITYKDVVATAGIRTTAASRVLENWIPDKDASVVTRLRKAGAITLGKVNLGEFTFPGGVTEQDFIKPPRNPWGFTYYAGGSSNGSAVGVAAGLAMGSVGTDGGGSIRIPAAYCGVTGFKPTYGRIGKGGVIPLTYSMGHLGPITRTVEDAAIMLEAMSGYDEYDHTSSRQPVPPYRRDMLAKSVRGLTIGLCPSYIEAAGVEASILSAMNEATKVLRSLGARTRDVVVPHLNYSCAAGYNTILRVEAFQYHFKNFLVRRDKYNKAFRNIARGGFLTARDYLRAQQARTLICSEVAAAFTEVDLLLLPVTPSNPSPASDVLASNNQYAMEGNDPKLRKGSLAHGAAYTVPFNLTGSPAISVPCGFSPEGLPIGLHLIGRAFEETTVLAAAHRYELATDWHKRRPPLDSQMGNV